MLVVRDIRVRSLATDYLYVSWRIENTPEQVSDYDFYVLRSGSPSGPYNVLSDALIDRYIWRDSRARARGHKISYYYRIKAVLRSTGDFVEYGSRTPEEVQSGLDPGGVSRDPAPNLVAREIAHRQQIALRSYNGRIHWLFHARTFGGRCNNCFDVVKKQRTVERCKICFGTSFVGGFFTPIQIYARGNYVAQQEPQMDRGPVQAYPQTFLVGNFPESAPGDVIVDPENNRWRVVRMQPSRVQGALVSQVLFCTRIIKSDIEYLLPLTGIDPIRLDFVDSRQYSGEPNLETVEDFHNVLQPREI